MKRRGWDAWPPPSAPLEAKGGIKARSQRGAFGMQWWAKRWIAVLEGFGIGSRLQRGRSYARKGQVLDVTIATGKVTARVQGSRPEPYRVTIRVPPLPKKTWRSVAARIAAEARFAARLVAGEMPTDIEEAFTAAGASLFPTRLAEIQTECSCPDFANPCKHIAATYYLLGEEFDRDPFLLFTLRGTTKEATLAGVLEAERQIEAPHADVVDVPLPIDLAAFWDGTSTAIVTTASLRTAHKRALPAFPFWRGSESLESFLARVDEAAVAAALDLLADADPD